VYFHAGGQPANAVAWEDDACNLASHDFFRDTRKTLELAYLRPRHDGYMDFQDTGGDLIHACLTRREPVEKTVDAMNEAYERSLA
jgi:multiple sugar transport system substrate-binding protein